MSHTPPPSSELRMRSFALWFSGKDAPFEETYRTWRLKGLLGLWSRLVLFAFILGLESAVVFLFLPAAGSEVLWIRLGIVCPVTVGWILSLYFKKNFSFPFPSLFALAACLDAVAAGFSWHPFHALFFGIIRLSAVILVCGPFLGILFTDLAAGAVAAFMLNAVLSLFFASPAPDFSGDYALFTALFALSLWVAWRVESSDRKAFLAQKDLESAQAAAEKEKQRAARKVRDLEEDIRIRSDTLQIAFENLASMQESTNTAHIETIHALSAAAEYKDEDTALHILRMSHYSALLAAKLGLPQEEVDLVLHNSPMHDIGKMGIPDHVLLKKGRLNKSEWELMKQHTIIGAKILSTSSSEFLETGKIIAISHHEKWDGTGYPYGLKDEQIPLYGRICAVADVFDALTSNRPYKEAYSNEKALEIMKKGSGTHFDPRILGIFFENLDPVLKIQKKFSEKNIRKSGSDPDFIIQKDFLSS